MNKSNLRKLICGIMSIVMFCEMPMNVLAAANDGEDKLYQSLGSEQPKILDEQFTVYRSIKPNGEEFYYAVGGNGLVFAIGEDAESLLPSEFVDLTHEDFSVDYAPINMGSIKKNLNVAFEESLRVLSLLKKDNTPEQMEDIRKQMSRMLVGKDDVKDSFLWEKRNLSFAKIHYCLANNVFDRGREDHYFSHRASELMKCLLTMVYQGIWCPRRKHNPGELWLFYQKCLFPDLEALPPDWVEDKRLLNMVCYGLMIFAENHGDILDKDYVARVLASVREFFECSGDSGEKREYQQYAIIEGLTWNEEAVKRLVDESEWFVNFLAQDAHIGASRLFYICIDELNLNFKRAFGLLQGAYDKLRIGGIGVNLEKILTRSREAYDEYKKYKCLFSKLNLSGKAKENMSMMFGRLMFMEQRWQNLYGLINSRNQENTMFVQAINKVEGDFQTLMGELCSKPRTASGKKGKKKKKASQQSVKPLNVSLFDDSINWGSIKFFSVPTQEQLKRVDALRKELTAVSKQYEQFAGAGLYDEDFVVNFLKKIGIGFSNISYLELKIEDESERLGPVEKLKKEEEEERVRERLAKIEAKRKEEEESLAELEQKIAEENARKREEQKRKNEEKREKALQAKALKEQAKEEELKRQELNRQKTKDEKKQEKDQSRKAGLVADLSTEKKAEKYEVVYFNEEVKNKSHEFLRKHSRDKQFVDAWRTWIESAAKEGDTTTRILRKLKGKGKILRGEGLKDIKLYPDDSVREENLVNLGKTCGMVVVYYIEKDTNKVVILYVGEHFGEEHGNEIFIDLNPALFVSVDSVNLEETEIDSSRSPSPVSGSQSASSGRTSSDSSSQSDDDFEKVVSKKSTKKH